MKIAIDVQTTVAQKSGFGYYVLNLVKNLKEIDKENEYILVRPNKEKDLSMPQRIIWDQIRFPIEAHKAHVDIVHQPCFSAPILVGKKTVVTIHDLIALNFPQNIPFFSRMLYSKFMPFSYHFADAFIVISEHTKKDVMKYLNIDPKKISVIYEAASEEFRPLNSNKDREKLAQILKKYKIDLPYILHIATLEPRKNLIFLVKAYAELIKDKRINHNLVITGKKGWYYQDLFQLVKDLGLSQKVIFTGYIDDEEKPYLYNGADLFVFPSLYEGFGLPPLEAMSCGTPIISSNTSSLPEIVGQSGILLPPTDKKSWVESMIKVLTDSDLRNDLSKKALEQAKKFSWKRNAEQTIEVYNKIYNSNK